MKTWCQTSSARRLRIALSVVATSGMSVAPVVPAVAQPLSARTIMTRNFYSAKVRTAISRIDLTLVSASGTKTQRHLRVTARLQKNGVYSDVVTRFTYPPDITGTEFLERQKPSGRDDLWIYLPALHSVRRILGNEKRSSFFGTDFSYGDILPGRVSDYRYTRLPSRRLLGHLCYTVESVPRSARITRETGYSRKISYIRRHSFVAERVVYFGRNGKRLKVLQEKDIRQIGTSGKHWEALWARMRNVRTRHYTILRVASIRADVRVPARYFTLRTLLRR